MVTVFVVDPDPSVRQSLAMAIRRAGWSPEIGWSPRAFVARAPTHVPSCLLLDVGNFLPDLTGFELLRRIRTERKEMQVVAMSGEPNIPLAVGAIQAGALEFLTKPVPEEGLRATVQRGLDPNQAVVRGQVEAP